MIIGSNIVIIHGSSFHSESQIKIILPHPWSISIKMNCRKLHQLVIELNVGENHPWDFQQRAANVNSLTGITISPGQKVLTT